MNANDVYFGTDEAPMTTPPMRTIWRLERRNHRLRIIMCWMIALTFATAFFLGYVMASRWR